LDRALCPLREPQLKNNQATVAGPTHEDHRRVFEDAPLRVRESRDPDGALRVALAGELDLAVADQLALRLAQLRRDQVSVRLDLSQLEFTDSTGIRVLVEAVRNGSENRHRLVEICPETMPSVRKLIELVGVGPVLWPADDAVS
jgi:anti-sigma B factor antagonist